MGGQAHLAQHTHLKTSIPAVLVGGNVGCNIGAIGCRELLWPRIFQRHILHMRAHSNAKMPRAQIGIGSVLHRPALRLQPQCKAPCEAGSQKLFSLHLLSLTRHCCFYCSKLSLC